MSKLIAIVLIVCGIAFAGCGGSQQVVKVSRKCPTGPRSTSFMEIGSYTQITTICKDGSKIEITE